ncbi:MAG: phosphoglycolate phosphatase [Sphingomonadales bacterium]
MTKPPILVFDLDGTLVDTAPDLMATLNTVLVAENLKPVSLDETRGMIGAGARALLERGFAANGEVRSEVEFDRLFDRFLEHYSAHIADASRPYPGVVAAMDRFEAEGWHFAVCTNKLEGLSRRLLEELGLADRFAAICGGDTFPVKKPDARHLFSTIAKAGGDPGNAVMVGDSATDIETAKAARVPVVAVSFGYTSVPVGQLGPDRVIDHFDSLDAAVRELRSAVEG